MTITIHIAYALPDEQYVESVQCESPVTIQQAINQSGLLNRFPDIELTDDMVGVYGYRQSLDWVLSDQDRVEVYRPLTVTPTEARRLRALKNKT